MCKECCSLCSSCLETSCKTVKFHILFLSAVKFTDVCLGFCFFSITSHPLANFSLHFVCFGPLCDEITDVGVMECVCVSVKERDSDIFSSCIVVVQLFVILIILFVLLWLVCVSVCKANLYRHSLTQTYCTTHMQNTTAKSKHQIETWSDCFACGCVCVIWLYCFGKVMKLVLQLCV